MPDPLTREERDQWRENCERSGSSNTKFAYTWHWQEMLRALATIDQMEQSVANFRSHYIREARRADQLRRLIRDVAEEAAHV